MIYFPPLCHDRPRRLRRRRAWRSSLWLLEAAALLFAFALFALWVWLCCQFAPAFAGFLLRLCLQPL